MIIMIESALLDRLKTFIEKRREISVAIYNVSSTNSTIKDAAELVKLNSDSEPFLLWITGEAYNEN